MKKLYLLCVILLCSFASYCQVIFEVQPPSPIAGYQPSVLGVAQSANGWAVPDMTDPLNAITGELVIVDDGTFADSIGCNPLINGTQVAGKIAVVWRGTCEFGTKALNAQNAGAIGVVIVNNVSGVLPGYLGGVDGPSVTIPVVMIPVEAGNDLYSYISGGVDVFIGTPPPADNDLKVVSAGWEYYTGSGSYSMIPQAQIQPWMFTSTTVANVGLLDQTNVITSIDVNSGLFSTSSTPQTVVIGDTIQPSGFSTFTPTGIGSYTVEYNVAGSTSDDVPSNNTITATYHVTDFLYARDSLVPTSNVFYSGNGYAAGNLFEIYADATAYGVQAVINPLSDVGTEVYAELWGFDGSNYNFYAMSNGYTLTSNDVTTGATIDLPFDAPVQLTVGPESYIAVIRSYGNGGMSNDLVVQTSGKAAIYTAWLYSDNDGQWYYLQNSPMVRLSFDCSNYSANLPQPSVSNAYAFACVSGCTNELSFSYQNASYFEIFDENNILIGSDSIASISSGSLDFNTIGTLCAGETYALVAKSRCDHYSAFIQESDTLYFQIDPEAIGVSFSQFQPASSCQTANGNLSFSFNMSNTTAGSQVLDFSWSGPSTGNVTSTQNVGLGGLGSWYWSPNVTNLLPGSYVGIVSSSGFSCDPVQFNFTVDVGDIVINESISVIGNTSTCTSIDGYVDLIAGGSENIDVFWNGPVSGSLINIVPSSSSTDFITIPSLSNGTYQVIVTFTGDPTCNSDTAYFNVMTNSISQDICVVTVDEFTSSFNVLVWEKPASMLSVDSFYVYREITTNNYQVIAAIDGDDLSEYEDHAANPNSTNYKYKITVLDSCGVQSVLSDYHNSIHLQYLGLGNFQWTAYEIENTSNQVASYNFYRDDNGSGTFNLLQVIPGGNTTYTDVDYATYPNAVYRVDVNWINGNTCTSTRANINTSRSNKKNQVAANPNTVVELLSNETTLMPVPAKEMVTLKLPEVLVNSRYSIVNSIGEVITSDILLTTNTTIDLGDMAEGMYLITIHTQFGVITKKLIKE